MTEIESRVARCFGNVFPDLPESDRPRASQASLASWDSVAHITLISAVSEEFGIDLEDESYESLSSFPLVVECVREKLGQ